MPITRGAKKAVRQASKKRVFNLRRKVEMKKNLKSISKLILDKKTSEAKALLSAAYKAIDKAAKRGIIKKNTASRKKSRLVAAIKRESQ